MFSDIAAGISLQELRDKYKTSGKVVVACAPRKRTTAAATAP